MWVLTISSGSQQNNDANSKGIVASNHRTALLYKYSKSV